MPRYPTEADIHVDKHQSLTVAFAAIVFAHDVAMVHMLVSQSKYEVISIRSFTTLKDF